MRALLLLPLLAALFYTHPLERARESQRGRGRESGQSLAFFEAFPASGAGVASVLAQPYPNWVSYSSDFSNAAWRKLGTGGATAAAVVASDGGAFYSDPFGGYAAQRVTFSDCGTAASQSMIDQATPGEFSAWTTSVYARTADAGTATVSLCVYGTGGASCAPRTITGSWARYDYTYDAGATRTSPYATIGCNNNSGYGGYSNTGTADLLLYGAQGNFGAVAPFIATTTAAKGYTVTGAKGEALTFTRTGTAYATRTASGGLATTGIADGDLVLMPANQPRVEYDSAGVLGLRVEAADTNSFLQSEAFDSAAWTVGNGGGATVPIVTANAGTAPNGTRTADRVQFSACVANGSYSNIYQTGGAGAGPVSVFVKGCLPQSDGGCYSDTLIAAGDGGSLYADGGVALGVDGGTGSGSISVCLFEGSGCTPCSYTASSWSRCSRTQVSTGFHVASFGCVYDTVNYPSGSSNTGAADVMLWGAQYSQTRSYVTSYIPTAAGVVSRNAETASFAIASTGPTACLAASVTWPSSSVGAVNFAAMGLAGNNFTLYRTSNTAAGFQINGTVTAPVVSAIGTTTHRALLYDNAGTRAAFWDGTSVSAPAATMASGATTLWVGHGVSGGVPADGIVSRVQVDPSALRCAP